MDKETFAGLFAGEVPRYFYLTGLLLLLLTGFFLYNPYLWRFHGLGEYTFISRGILTMGILALILLFGERSREKLRNCGKGFLFCWGGLFIFTLFQWGRVPGGTLEELGGMEFFLLFPLLSLIYSGEIRSFVRYFLALLGGYQLFLCAYHTPFLAENLHIPGHRADWTLFMAGITGNANWTSSLLLLTLPFLLLFLHRLCRKWKVLLPVESVILLVPFLGGVYFVYKLESMGSILAFLGSCGVMIFLFMGKRRKYILLGGGLLLLIFSIFLFLPGKGFSLYEAGNVETRLQLLLAGSGALLEAPLTGYGHEGIVEGVLSGHRTEGYFLADLAAARSNHPHNEILMRLLLSGIPAGLLFWGFFIFFPLWKAGKELEEETVLPWKLEKKEQERLLYFWALLFLLFHGQLDLVLFVWPLQEIFLLLLGVFWEECFCRERGVDGEKKIRFPCFVKGGLLLFSLLLLGGGGFYAGRNLFSMKALRGLDFDPAISPEAKIEAGKKAVLLSPHNGQALYKFMVFSVKERRWQDALFFADRFPFTLQKNYGRNHGFRGQILARLGRYEEAFFAYKKDGELFPLAVLPIFNMIQLASPAGKREYIGLLRKELERRKKLMGFSEEKFRLILQGRHNEMRF